MGRPVADPRTGRPGSGVSDRAIRTSRRWTERFYFRMQVLR